MADPKISEIVNKSNQIIYPKTQVAAILDWDTQWNAKAVSENLVNTTSLNSILNQYATVNDLATTASVVSNLMANVDTLSTTLAAVPVTYVTKTGLSDEIANLGIPTANTLENFYTKSEIDNNFATVSTLSGYYTKAQANSAFVTTSSLSTSLSNYYTKSEASNLFVDGSNVWTRSQVYTTTYIDNNFYPKDRVYPKEDVYTQSETDAKISTEIVNIMTGGEVNLTGYVTTTALTTSLQNYVTTSALTETLSSYVETVNLGNYVTVSQLTNTLSQYVLTGSLPIFSQVASTGDYNDLINKPEVITSKQSYEAVTSNLLEANLLSFNNMRINASNFATAIFIIICHMNDGNGGIITNGWAVIPNAQLKQQLFSSDQTATIYPDLAYGSSGSRNLGVKITGAQVNNEYNVDVFILKTK